MSELQVSTPEEYSALTTTTIKVSSGGVFHIQNMNASSYVYLVGMLPGTELTAVELSAFTLENYEALLINVVQPNILEPKIANDRIAYADVADLLIELMTLSGMVEKVEQTEEEEEVEEEHFPDDKIGDTA